YKKKAWEELQRSSDDLSIVLVFIHDYEAPEKYRIAAVEEIWKRSPEIYTLKSILSEAPRAEDRDRAAEKLLNLVTKPDDIEFLMESKKTSLNSCVRNHEGFFGKDEESHL